MNRSLIIILILAILLLGGGLLIFRARTSPQVGQGTQITGQSGGPEGTTSEEVERSNYRLFDKAEFEKALSEGKVVMFYFTANWCPICREQEPINKEALSELAEDPTIVAFRVHILDSETTKEGEALADEYAVRYQHTTVILNSKGEVSETTTGPILKENLKEKLLAAK